MTKTHDGTGVYCGCCAREKLLEVRPGQGVAVTDGRHGRRHSVLLGPREVLERITGTTDGSAIMTYVQAWLR